MNRDLPTTTEGIRTHAMRAHSLIGNLWWLLPPAAALFYPQGNQGAVRKWQAAAPGDRAG